MTICIGAICNKNIVITADRMVTLQIPPTEFEHTSSKIDKLTDKALFLSAGNVLPAMEILKRTREKLGVHPATTIEETAKVVAKTYEEFRLEQVETLFLKPRKFTLDSFYNQGKNQSIPQQLAIALDNQMVQYNPNIELIIAGIDELGGHLYTISNPGLYMCHDKIGYVAVGSGSMHAISSFISNRYSVDCNLNKGVYYTFEAKFFAERAPGVGAETDMGIISNKGIKYFSTEEVALLRDSCAKIIKPKEEVGDKIIAQLPFEKDAKDAERKSS